ncbi:conserved hypothetical protein [Hyphomicrobiales bacterium]|nr:conserved hypothetical protein [Hyphomicrobiales bacterium]CAI0343575.1 conserved hypothetical protein [Hyphomicrobiales bacterium]
MFDVPTGEPRPLRELTEFLYHKLRQGMSYEKLRSMANTVGLLHDFLVLHEGGKAVTAESLPSLILGFFVSRTGGTIGTNNQDPSGLYWAPVGYDSYKMDRRNLRSFSEYCLKTYGFLPLTPTISTLSASQNGPSHADIRAEFQRSKHEFLAHLRRWRERRPEYGPNISGRAAPKRTGNPTNRSYIPLNELRELILSTKSVVQRMVFVLGAFGGCRISEQLNIWREDVLPGLYRPILFPDDQPSDVPLVILAHPFDGQYLGRMSIDGATRHQELQRTYNRRPRPALIKSDRAGWKGMLMDNEQLQISQIFWTSEAWAAYYFQLTMELKERIFPQIPTSVRRSHPYILINDDPGTEFFGQPLKLSNVRKAWERACRRIDRVPYRGAYHLHGLRDTYVRTLRLCKEITAAERQRYLHHASIESQNPYGNDPRILHERLKILEEQQPSLRSIR